MPQFDLSSFIVQLISLFLLFLFFYFVFSWKYLASYASLLKVRTKLNNTPNFKNVKFKIFKIYTK